MYKKKNFDDVTCASLNLSSSWLQSSLLVSKKSIHTQTPSEFHHLQEREVQSGRFTRIIQDQVSIENAGSNIIEHLAKKHNRIWGVRDTDFIHDTWKQKVNDGLVTVDCEIVTDTETKLEQDAFVEFVDFKAHIGTQTDAINAMNKENQNIFMAETKAESKSESKESKADSKREKNRKGGLQQFLDNVLPMVLEALDDNERGSIFESLLSIGMVREDDTQTLLSWKVLSVDLEKKKVLYPDWNKAKYHTGVIVNCVSTRNKERVYDIEFDDGGKLFSVREEYIRLVEEDNNQKGRARSNVEIPKRSQIQSSRLQEGIRVHARILTKSGYKFLPGRIVKVSRTTFDVECEGKKIESGLTTDDLCIGLSEGQRVEARKPQKVQLQCTGISWNSTGNMLACSFGKNDIIGWCNFPGAVCIWNIFGKEFDHTNPDFVFDHPSCIMTVAYHPLIPSIVAAGSYNGEIIVWDLSVGESLLAISPITEYSHKDPVVSLRWVFNSQLGGDNWWLVSISTDGKVLFWSLANKLQHPMKGYFLQKPRMGGTRNNKNHVFGASSFAFSCGTNSIKQLKPKWIVVGHVGGSICRAQMSKLGGNPLNAEMLKSNPNIEDLYGPLQRMDDSFSHEHHVGAVSGIDWSPFHRNLFICTGLDSKVKLFHILEQSPIRVWEPLSHMASASNDLTLSSITAVAFSPIRPLLFAVTTSSGYLMMFDMSDPTGKPVASYFIDGSNEASLFQEEERSKDSRKGQKIAKTSGVCLTGLSFNHKQRDLIGVCDWVGKIHVIKLSWKLANKHSTEQTILDEIGNLSVQQEEY